MSCSFCRGALRLEGRPVFFLLLSLLLAAHSAVAAAGAREFRVSSETQEFTPASFRGRPLVLYFMTFTCPHCNKIEPLMKEVASAHPDRYGFLAVVFGTPAKELHQRKKERGIAFPLAVGTKQIAGDYAVKGVPYLWLLDSAGNPMDRFSGEPGAKLLHQALAPCREKKSAPDCLVHRSGVYELAHEADRFLNQEREVAARLVRQRDGRLALTNGMDHVNVRTTDKMLGKLENRFVVAKGRLMQGRRDGLVFELTQLVEQQ